MYLDLGNSGSIASGISVHPRDMWLWLMKGMRSLQGSLLYIDSTERDGAVENTSVLDLHRNAGNWTARIACLVIYSLEVELWITNDLHVTMKKKTKSNISPDRVQEFRKE